MSSRAEGDGGGREGGRGVQERLRGLQRAAILLQRRIRHARHLQALLLFPDLQDRLPTRL
ncbi:hypothetical protein Fmac_032966 [Flemingia macrophylla]|uniref:Uncharacterized protein n=1 Tax=Flemingia macrophylla TaxID=520843 RepID=A0ABD1L6E9_9FABA